MSKAALRLGGLLAAWSTLACGPSAETTSPSASSPPAASDALSSAVPSAPASSNVAPAASAAIASVHHPGRLYFYDAALLSRSATPDGEHLHFVPAISSDGKLVADLVSEDDAMTGFQPHELLVRRVSDDSEVKRFDISRQLAGKIAYPESDAARAASIKAVRAAVDAANDWLAQHKWDALEQCAGPMLSSRREQPDEVACRARTGVDAIRFLRPTEAQFTPPSSPPTLQIERAGGSLRRDVSAWFPWFTEDGAIHCRWPEVATWARPRADGPLVVFTFVQVGGACHEPMSDFHVLPLPR